MLDLKFIRENVDSVRKSIRDRGAELDLDELLRLDSQRRELTKRIDDLRAQRKRVSKQIGELKRKGSNFEELMVQIGKTNSQLKNLVPEWKQIQQELNSLLLLVPNIPAKEVPVGKDESENKEINRWGRPRKFDFSPRPHWEIGESLGILDFPRAGKISGTRFTLYKGLGAELERALVNFMLAEHKKNGYQEILPPFMVTAEAMTGTGQLPKFAEDLYKCKDDNLYLIPTAEVPLVNLHQEEVLSSDELPLKYTAYSPCFRREAGSYGKDTKGLIRQHQFNKVELVKFTKPEESLKEFESLLKDAQGILGILNLPYRVMLMCTGELGFSAALKYDLEVWMPAQNRYREISSCSHCADFQARRANIKYADKDGKVKFVHTLNGSGLAVGRTTAAVLENYQTANGRVEIPKVLRPYLDGLEYIS